MTVLVPRKESSESSRSGGLPNLGVSPDGRPPAWNGGKRGSRFHRIDIVVHGGSTLHEHLCNHHRHQVHQPTCPRRLRFRRRKYWLGERSESALEPAYLILVVPGCLPTKTRGSRLISAWLRLSERGGALFATLFDTCSLGVSNCVFLCNGQLAAAHCR